MDKIINHLSEILPYISPLAVIALFMLAGHVLSYVLNRRSGTTGTNARGFRAQLLQLGLGLVGVLVFLLSLPIGESMRGQLLSLFGILLSMAVAISSTTFVGNVMAGLMLKSVRTFRSGDFIRVEGHFGRVTQRSLLFTEIQTEDRDLLTLPNLFLANHPVRLLQASGTIVSATVSLGYDVPRRRIEDLLLAAAAEAELTDPFVQVMDLGDFSVSYRVAGLLGETRQLLTARSRLRGLVLDHLHGGGVEIVSPNFMNQRVFDTEQSFIPSAPHPGAKAAVSDDVPEEILFDKADQAQSLIELKKDLEETIAQLKDAKQQAKSGDDTEKAAAQLSVDRLTRRQERLALLLTQQEEMLDGSED